MPNLRKHATVGAAVGGGANLVWQVLKILDDPNRPKDFWDFLSRINFLELAAFAAGGAVIASLPDILEPASSPNHRAMFHSFAFGAAVTYGAFGKHSEMMMPNDRHLLQTAALSYLSHLFLDCQTPKCLPLVGLPKIEI